jgi:hypothetical protein
MITNLELIDKAQELRIPLIGVYSKDRLPYKRQNGGYIINLEDDMNIDGTPNSGSHWTCFYIDGKQACYMDSFGIIAPRQVQEFLKPYAPFPYNTKQIQNIKSQVCGYYCLFFLYWFHNQKKIKSFPMRLQVFTDIFSDDDRKNEDILKKYLKTM